MAETKPIFDGDFGSIPLRCPNCASRNPIIKAIGGEVDVQFPHCGAHEKLTKTGQIHVLAECRVKPGKRR